MTKQHITLIQRFQNGDWSYFQVVNGIEHALLKGYAGILISRGAKVVRGTRA